MSPKTQARRAAQIAEDIRKAHLIPDPKNKGKKIPDPLAAGTLEKGGRAVVDDVCPTGSMVIDKHVLGVGGLAKGRTYEVGGAEGAGKTSWVCQIMGQAQRDGMQVVLTDKENKFHTGWAERLGKLDLADVIEHNAESVEAYHAEMLRLMSKHGYRTQFMFVLDSVPPLMPIKALKGEVDDEKAIPGVQALAWSRGLAFLSPALLETGSILILINQLRSKIGVMFGPTEDTPAGRAIKHYATCRFMVYHGKGIKDGDVPVGRYMKVVAYKNGLTGIGEGVDLRLMRETGFDDRWSVINHAKEVGCIAQDAATTDDRYLEALANLGWGSAHAEAVIKAAKAAP